MTKAIVYQIRIQEQLGEQWAEWFDPLLIQLTPNGSTILTGPLRDQAQLHGLLVKVHNLNLTLISVNQLKPTDQ
ncbi:MAG: hypothetical protein NT075_25500 [Chloroflexi bacterium]|nr:hypothetical protein [Chloroflexota bacterium]